MTGLRQPRSNSPDCYIGIDLGTSGVRAVAIDLSRKVVAGAVAGLAAPLRARAGLSEQSPQLWWEAVIEVLRSLVIQLPDHRARALAVDGTSSTLLLSEPDGTPLTPGLMYDDTRSRDNLELLAAVAPPASPVHSASSSLAKLLHLSSHIDTQEFLALHQSDWILGRLSGRYGVSDENNCLKLGYDPVARDWPKWMDSLPIPPICLPHVHPPGRLVGRLSDETARLTGLPNCCRLVTGTTDSNAATLATGVSRVGEAVTSLGSTLVLKILSDRPVVAPEYGVYSHRLEDQWLVGGASNSGGAVCAHYFTPQQISEMTARLDPDKPTGLDYYPLNQAGERFPVNDPDYPPRLSPRTASDIVFFQAILEGIANIEKTGYALLHRLGAPAPQRIISIGGGAANEPWRKIRQRFLGVPVTRAVQSQAAYGSALLALKGCL